MVDHFVDALHHLIGINDPHFFGSRRHAPYHLELELQSWRTGFHCSEHLSP